VAAAESYLGVPYVWGGASRQGVDCSGLAMVVWAAAGVGLLHGATVQDEESTRVSLADIEPGDLLFYHFANDGPLPITHVAIYIGSGPYGTQTIIQAAEVGTNVAYYPMYWPGFVSAGRP
jgi:cell wall-associated NlpC family hydrolase